MTKGFQSTHIGQICKNLNIARGTVYQYFGNKREILYAILDSAEEQIGDILDFDDLTDFLQSNPSQHSIVQFITYRITEISKHIINEPILIKLIFKKIHGIDDEIEKKIDTFLERLTSILSRDIEELKKKNIYKEDIDSCICSFLLWGGILFLLYNYNKNNKDISEIDTISLVVNSHLFGVIQKT